MIINMHTQRDRQKNLAILLCVSAVDTPKSTLRIWMVIKYVHNLVNMQNKFGALMNVFNPVVCTNCTAEHYKRLLYYPRPIDR
jgi:hypothetical protein